MPFSLIGAAAKWSPKFYFQDLAKIGIMNLSSAWPGEALDLFWRYSGDVPLLEFI